jgi:hypothetical protein
MAKPCVTAGKRSTTPRRPRRSISLPNWSTLSGVAVRSISAKATYSSPRTPARSWCGESLGEERAGVDGRGGDEFIRQGRHHVHGHARAHAVAHANLRGVNYGGRVGCDRVENHSGVRDDTFGLHGRDHLHQLLSGRPGHALSPDLVHVEGEPRSGAVEEVRRRDIEAAGREPTRVLLDLLAVADRVHVEHRHRERPTPVGMHDEDGHQLVGRADTDLLLAHSGQATRRGMAGCRGVLSWAWDRSTTSRCRA